MNGAKWTLLFLMMIALLAFGYKVRIDQQTPMAGINRGPIAVAAVRGSSEDAANSIAPVSNAGVDYVNSLQEDVKMAQRAADKYQSAAKSRENQVASSFKDTAQ